MIVTVQAVPSRMPYVESYIKKVFPKALVHVDEEMTGSFNSFKTMLHRFPTDQYRLHLQDDIVLSNRIWRHLGKIIKHMKASDMHCVSLFSVRKRSLNAAFDRGEKYVRNNNFYGHCCLMLSPYLQDLFREESESFAAEGTADDIFTATILKKHGIAAYSYLPVLCQHNIQMASTLGHKFTMTKRYQSDLFQS